MVEDFKHFKESTGLMSTATRLLLRFKFWQQSAEKNKAAMFFEKLHQNFEFWAPTPAASIYILKVIFKARRVRYRTI